MSKLPNRPIRWIVYCGIVFACVGTTSAQVVLKEDFESGPADVAVPTNAPPWRVNDSGLPVTYRTTNHPFASGTKYGYVNDNVSAAGSTGTRFMTTDAVDTDQVATKIGGLITTLSFDFWEAATDNATLGQPGLGFGYYGTGIDLNAAGRNYRGFLRDGMLNPDSLVAGSGAATAYTRETVQTIYMLCNDTATALDNYRDGRTLAANQADVWIQAAGGDPVFAFSVNDQHVGTNNRGAGFRTFTLDTEEIYLNNILLNTGATFDRSAFNAPAGVLGDYNGNGTVDAADYVLWRDNPATLNNDSTPGSVGPEDYAFWKSHFGATSNGAGSGGAVGVANVPEPSIVVLLLPIVFLSGRRRIASKFELIFHR